MKVEFERHLHANLRECWVLASNRRHSATSPAWSSEPTIHAIAIETIRVDESEQRKGLCRRFIEMVAADPRFDMTIVEGVQNPVLAEALLRWGWGCDPKVMDFYKEKAI